MKPWNSLIYDVYISSILHYDPDYGSASDVEFEMALTSQLYMYR